jgi:starvation-inducible DNA-binding protein
VHKVSAGAEAVSAGCWPIRHLQSVRVSTRTFEADTHLPPLGGRVREQVMLGLQQTLIELIDLGLVGKQLHWTVVGEHFQPVHQQLDDLVDSWRELADTVAERIVAVGGSPDGQATAVASGSGWSPIEPRPVESQEVVRALAHRLAETDERTRDRMHRLGELDLVSQDVLIQVLRELEKQLWMVRAQLSSLPVRGKVAA